VKINPPLRNQIFSFSKGHGETAQFQFELLGRAVRRHYYDLPGISPLDVFANAEIEKQPLTGRLMFDQNTKAGAAPSLILSSNGGSMNIDVGPLIRAPLSLIETLTDFCPSGIFTEAIVRR
jgi:hypothetical protein